ncbi:glycosyl hydrolase family 18 protein [Clostridium paraputrificum]|uniref:glycosyl hydrolase family 18 protein n=1 Tax=Clostridium TaxID=1485 RepID=UPI003D358D58
MKGIRLKKVLAGVLLSVFVVSNMGIAANAVTEGNVTKDTKASTIGSGAKPAKGDLKRKVVGYFPSWAYNSSQQAYFDAADLQWDDLTHIQYSFGSIDENTHKLKFDKKAAIEEDFKDHPLEHKGKEVKLDPSLPYKGHFNVLQTMKKQYPDVKLMLSIGGWAECRGFYPMLDTDAGINTFAESCVEFLKQYNFDGIDIDFEYPSSTQGSGNVDSDGDLSEPRRGKLNERYNVLIKVLREKIDEAAKKDSKKYLLTAAVTASAWVLGGVPDNTYANYLDFLSVMSYDFHGGWNQYVEHLASIYPDAADTETIGQAMPYLNMDWAYRFYRGVLPAEKIIMGIPYYTRGWENVQGGTNGLHGTAGSKENPTPATGEYNYWGDPKYADQPQGDKVPAGANPLWHILNLMEKNPNIKLNWDDTAKVPYIWDSQKKVFLSFENERSIDERVKYIKDKNLGGALIWVMNGDYGLNPNYKAGSTNPNEGKYNFGNTLTSRLKKGLDGLGDCKVTDDIGSGAIEVIDVDVQTDSKYDHPNGEVNFTITNNTGFALPKEWTLSFDIPKSAIYTGAEGAQDAGTVTEVGDFYRVTLKASSWQTVANGGKATIKAKTKLCISGVRNIRVNGKVPANIPINNNHLPTLKGVTDKIIAKGSNYNSLSGITATDIEDGDLTSKIYVNNLVDTNKEGWYKLTYTVSDNDGIEVSRTANIYIIPSEHSSAVVWDAGGTYAKDSKVIYDGKIYQYTGWYNPPGTIPSAATNWNKLFDLPSIVIPNPNPKPDDIITMAKVADRYNELKGSSRYELKYDFNNDNIIDIYDIVKVARELKN